jgi:hypothetical protein
MTAQPRTTDNKNRAVLIELCQQFSAPLFHLSNRVFALFVIKANQVQNPMNEKTGNRTIE